MHDTGKVGSCSVVACKSHRLINLVAAHHGRQVFGIWSNPAKLKLSSQPLGAKERTNNDPNPQMASTPNFEPGPHWWKVSALTTAPSLAPQN